MDGPRLEVVQENSRKIRAELGGMEVLVANDRANRMTYTKEIATVSTRESE